MSIPPRERRDFGKDQPPPILDWKTEMERKDVKPLRDVLTTGANAADFAALTNESFSIQPQDIALINTIGNQYRKKLRIEQQNWDRTYDYSPESQIFLAFIYHKMKELQISEELQVAFSNFRDIWAKDYNDAPNHSETIEPASNKSYWELTQEAAKVLKNVAGTKGEERKITQLYNWAEDYFRLMHELCYAKKVQWQQKYFHPVLGDVPGYEGKNDLSPEAMGAMHCYYCAIRFPAMDMQRAGFSVKA
jgi:hypothetical protein